ncbi:MAG: hypothetical protein JTJ12_18260 [Eubacterium sp.]|uniref:hypothetical protein n=1 Tax=Anaerobutyricum hallii TaxID=39488 RepID=UPI000F4F5E37|nr:hypothetical protein [Anaerobutyricum hallii]MBN2929306.1 hypothetical protein [Eubacterium sp.]
MEISICGLGERRRYCNFYIAKGCTWTVTIKGTDGTVYVQGNSEYTITVSSYSTKADMSGATESTAWKDYEVSKPSEL